MNRIDARRNDNISEINNNKLAWNICNKYTKNFNRILDKNNMSVLIDNRYKMYLLELKSNNISINVNNKYIMCWTTMINTINKMKNSNMVKRNSINQLNYISHINL